MNAAALLEKLPPETTKLILQTAARLWQFAQVERVMLYGSHAKLTQTEESDIDIAVFVQNAAYGKAIFKQIARACLTSQRDVQVQVFPLADLAAPCGIIEEILAYGVELPRQWAQSSVCSGEGQPMQGQFQP